MNKGRAAGFTEKLVEGKPVVLAMFAARYGDTALTKGATMVEQYQNILQAYKILRAPAWRKRSNKVRDEILDAILCGDSKLLREMADYIDAKKQYRAEGAVGPGFEQAARFVSICRNMIAPIPRRFHGDRFRGFPATIIDAVVRGPHTPSVGEIHSHLAQRMLEPPSQKTVERWARKLGIKARSKKAGRK